MKRITQAIVLAAGEGQRLKPFTKLMPKVMLPIADKPILRYVVEALAQNGVRRVVMVVGYRKENVQDYFGSGKDFGVEIDYVIQPQQLGTAHALKQAAPLADDRFLVVAGDNIIGAGTIAPLVQAEKSAMLIKRQHEVSRYGVVVVRDGLVKDIIEKPIESISNLVNTGAYSLSKDVFDFIGDEVRLTTVIQQMIAQGYDIIAQQTDDVWLDAAYPWDILSLNDLILGTISSSIGGTIEDGAKIKGPVIVGDRTTIRSNCYIAGPVIIGQDCEIGPDVCIFPSTSVGNNVVLSPFSVIRNSSIANNVIVGPISSIEDSVIAPGSLIGSHFSTHSEETTIKIENEFHQVKMGAIIGSYAEIGDNVVMEAGTVVGNNCRIRSMKNLRGNIPDGGLVV